MREFFEFGFEQVQAKAITIKENNFIADAKEFEKGGKFERFANYTRERFENDRSEAYPRQCSNKR